jgi:hypothetical protein
MMGAKRALKESGLALASFALILNRKTMFRDVRAISVHSTN